MQMPRRYAALDSGVAVTAHDLVDERATDCNELTNRGVHTNPKV
jgi:hypothetical protein